MEEKKVLDDIFKIMYLPPDSPISATIQAYNNALIVMRDTLKKKYDQGFNDCLKIQNQNNIENQKNQN